MTLVLALGSNLGDRHSHLANARKLIDQHFSITHCSKIYRSEPVDIINQPEFLNQVVQCQPTKFSPLEILSITQAIEQQEGGHSAIPKGPRHLDIDILFIGHQVVNLKNLIVPHPSIKERSFVLLPLRELPFYKEVCKQFHDKNEFSSWAIPIDPNQ